MNSFLQGLDELAGTGHENRIARWLRRAAFVFLVLMLVSAPHSIAATQTAWITGMFLWLVSLIFKPRPRFRITLLDGALWAFFFWSVVTSIFSYDPATSVDMLRGVAIFLIFYFVVYNLRSLRAVYFAAFTLIISCMVNVVLTPVQRVIGRGVAIHGIRPDSPLAKATIVEGDAILDVNGKKIRFPEDITSAIEQNEVAKIRAFRKDFDIRVEVKRAEMLPGETAMERLGFESWTRNRSWRSSGFYGHYTTYAEVLQLIASLTLGLLVAGFFAGRGRRANEIADSERGKRGVFVFLFIGVAGMCLALLLTVTRASQLAFLISGFVIFAAGASRKWLIAAVAVGLPLALAGLFILQQSRDVGFFDSKDLSTLYRVTMWRDGVRLWSENPRHIVLGVGMDSIKTHWQEWNLFDKGHLPMGHFHSTPVQLLVERGLPALLIWLTILGIYARTLWKALKSQSTERSWISTGILLGCLGGAIGFFTSGIVHYNLGDQEVAMVFFILMGFGSRIVESTLEPTFERG
ncbi:MAG: O-antigen ligase family protein [Saprospiraceae bacterium]|nr:O-antigen ligase family protein [Pyrinomonadaceae bacterium]